MRILRCPVTLCGSHLHPHHFQEGRWPEHPEDFAYAEGSSEVKAKVSAAEGIRAAGNTLFKAGNYAEACSKYTQSLRYLNTERFEDPGQAMPEKLWEQIRLCEGACLLNRCGPGQCSAPLGDLKQFMHVLVWFCLRDAL